MRVFLTLLFGIVSPTFAQGDGAGGGSGKDEFARHWPVQVSEAGLYAVTLTPELYAQVQRADLGDLAAFNGDGEALAFEPMAAVWQSPEPQWRPAHVFALPAGTEEAAEGLALQVEKAADGSVSLRAETEAPEKGGSALLIDSGLDPEEHQRLHTIVFDFDSAAGDFNAQVRVDASSDLETWRTLATGAGLLRLEQGGRTLQRQKIELGGAAERYLRVIRLDGSDPLPVAGVRVETRDARVPDPGPTETLEVESTAVEEGAFLYRLPARIPIERIHLRLAEDNTVAAVQMSSRESSRDPWRSRGRLTAFRLRAEGVELENEFLSVHGDRDREWRLQVENELREAPTLVFSYRPERWLLLTQGPGPSLLAAGSRRAQRERMPLKALLAPIRAKYGDDWQPPEAALGEPVLAAGEAALEATAVERWSGAALWGLLIASALAITFMVVRLLREQPDP